ncbi:nuclear transport factor 2 family protein [Nocardia sp. NBC_01388]|uniref:nuclear transport factor 2 family protein n=1 Tax=Nocardia sp. NBC_01388 TaxID=2903596 RepID=UPI0032502D31
MSTDLRRLSDRTEIVELLSGYLAAVDDKRLDRTVVTTTFAADGRIVRPNGAAVVGHDNILESQSTSFARFRATHHVTGDHLVEIDGGTARMRANLTAMHLWSPEESDSHSLETHFLAGGVFDVRATRTGSGWRLTEMALHNTWRSGTGVAAMLATR